MDQDARRLGAEDETLASQESSSHGLTIRRGYALPRPIVWDALVDPVLVSGWLGDLDIDPRVGGRYRLRYGAPADRRPQDLSRCRIRALAAPVALELEDGGHRMRIELEDVPGGPRDRSTVLHLAVLHLTASSADPEADVGRIRAAWLLHLDQLDELLHGRPVDWTCWTDVQDEAWLEHLAGPPPRKR